MTIAGLWSKWTDKATGDDLKSCTMVITGPNKLAAEVHDRMPVILETKVSLLKSLSGLGIGLPMEIATDDFD